jgi:hypothetical protein
MAGEARERVLGAHFDWCVSVLSDIDRGVSATNRSPGDAEILRAVSWALGSRIDEAMQLAAMVGRVWWAAGRTESARRILGRAIDDPRTLESSAGFEEALWFAVQYALAEGDLEAAARDISRHGDLVAQRQNERDVLLHEQLQAGLLSLSGRYDLAIGHQATAAQVLERLGDPEATHALASHAYLLARRGHTQAASSEIARLGALAARWDQPVAGALRERVLGWCSLWEGDGSGAGVHFTSALAIFETQHHLPGLVTTLRDLAWLALAGGDAAQAVDHARSALQVSGGVSRPGTDRVLHCILAAAWAGSGNLTSARAALGRGREGLDDTAPIEDLVWALRAAAAIDASAGQATRAGMLASFSEISLGESDGPYPRVLEEWWETVSARIPPDLDASPDAQRSERLMLAAEVVAPLLTD